MELTNSVGDQNTTKVASRSVKWTFIVHIIHKPIINIINYNNNNNNNNSYKKKNPKQGGFDLIVA